MACATGALPQAWRLHGVTGVFGWHRRHEVEQYDGLLEQAERLGVSDVVTVSALNFGQACMHPACT